MLPENGMNLKHGNRFLHEGAGLSIIFGLWLWRCWDILSNFSTQIYQVGTGIDGIAMIWMSWWTKIWATNPDMSLFFTPYLNYPIGLDVMASDVAFYQVMLAGLLSQWLGLAGGINFVFCAGTLLGLLGIYLLIRQVSKNPIFAACLTTIPAIFALFVYGWPNDLEMANMGFWTMALAMWLSLVEKGGTWRIVTTGFLIAAALMNQMYYGIGLLMLIALGLLLTLVGIFPLEVSLRQFWRRTLMASAIGTAVALPHFLAVGGKLAGIRLFAAAPPVLPEMNGFFGSEIFWKLAVLAVFCVFAAFAKSKKVWFWMICLSALVIFSFKGFQIPGSDPAEGITFQPAYWLKRIVPFLWRLTFPERLAKMAVVILAVLLGQWGRTHFEKHETNFGTRTLTVSGIFIAGFFIAPLIIGAPPVGMERLSSFSGLHGQVSLAPIPTENLPHAPKELLDIKSDQDDFAVLDLTCSEMGLYYQIFHEKPMPGNLLVPLLRKEPSFLTSLQEELCYEEGPDLPEGAMLLDHQIRYVLISRTTLRGKELAELGEIFYGPPVYQDDSLAIFKILEV